jgi:putative salt-induced outer membrane protein YdiY
LGAGIARRLAVRCSLAALLAALGAPAQAQAPPPAPPAGATDRWSGKVGLGYSAVTGNARSSNVALELAARLDAVPWHHEGSALGLRATSTDQTTEVRSTTAERYALGYKLKFDFNEFDYGFGNLGYERDLFSGYRRQLSEVAGYGRRIFNTGRQV